MSMPFIARLPHIIITALLLLGPILHYLGVHNFSKHADLLAMPMLMGLGTFPDVPMSGDWTVFWLNLTIAVGALYAKVAITGDIGLAKDLCIARGTIAVFNFASLVGIITAYPPMPKAFWSFTIIEAATVVLVLATLPDTKAKGKKA